MANWLNYCWRLVATGFGFVLFGVGGIVIPPLAAPIIYLLGGEQQIRRQRARALIQKTFALFISILRLLGVLRWHVINRERLLESGQLIVANHPTLLDVVFLVSLVPDACCIVKGNLRYNPAMRGFLAITGYITNDNGTQMLADAESVLTKGSSLIVFPEGTRSTPYKPLKFQRGAANMAVHTKSAMLPVTISCAPISLTKNSAWYDIPGRPLEFRIIVGDRIGIDSYLHKVPTVAVRQLTQDLQDYFTKELKEMTASSNLELEIKQLIIEVLDLEDISPEQIETSEPLFGDGLGLDSIDALELGIAMQKRYGIKLDAETEETKQHFASVANLVALVQSHGK